MNLFTKFKSLWQHGRNMTIFTKDPRSAEVLAVLKKEGKVLLEVVTTRLYIIDSLPSTDAPALETLCQEWFVKYRGRSHAWRDSCHIGGGDEASIVKVMTEGGRIIDMRPPPMPLPHTTQPATSEFVALNEAHILALDLGLCPDCGRNQLTEGPRGGCSTNIYCDLCGAGFNMVIGIEGPFGKERIRNPTQLP
jgi:hypothetical protein